ncbi:oxidoreductase [Paraglaciecola sp. MB-3u-78]|uniref:oxidoreductase n=1 Tax=Paraglaciecola sp. MB-3u-78 TaxID=2058332 RepID=UPI000C348F10|nr:oxidoreductase [Paraglaciecola sp. MB-3u-78]PKG98918.1 flagellin modification protein A [Paraglaciecola sp. MB-3u-78]
MNSSLDNKKIVVVGSAGLLGSNLVARLLTQGAEVIAVDLDLNKLESRLALSGVDLDDQRLFLQELDITDEPAVRLFFKYQQGLTGAVNTTYPRNLSYGAHFFDVSMASFNENVSLHLGSCFLFTQQCAAYFKAQQSPFSLVNISSVYGVVAPKFGIYESTPMTMPVEYAAIKSATLHLNKYVAAYVNDSRFRINAVSPGGIFDHQPEAFLKAYQKNTHGEGMLDVEDVMGSIVFLLSEQSKFVTGQNVIVDDGFSL